MNKNTALALGIPSVLVLLGGILVSILFYLLTSNVVEGINEANERGDFLSRLNLTVHGKSNGLFDTDRTGQLYGSPQSAHHRSERSTGQKSSIASATDWPLWGLGVAYIFIGLLGLLSAFLQKRGLYITSIVFSVLVLLIMAVASLFIVFLIFIGVFAFAVVSSDNCYDENGVCKCRDSNQSFDLFKSCSFFTTIFSLSMSLSFFLVFTWVALMVLFIMFCYYTCCAKTQGSSGVVLIPAQQPMIPPNQGDPSYTQQTYQYPPPQQYFDQTAPSKV